MRNRWALAHHSPPALNHLDALPKDRFARPPLHFVLPPNVAQTLEPPPVRFAEVERDAEGA